jgi:ATP-binding cassette, sub-family E, member 1
MFDEPTSYLDIKYRLKAAKTIRSLITEDNYVIAVEHDLSIIDYLSDFICVIYGVPGAYGVVTIPYSVREGINVFLSGSIPKENSKFREFEVNFYNTVNDSDKEKPAIKGCYPAMTKTIDSFKITV